MPKTGRYVYYPGTLAVPEHSAANTHVSSWKVLAEVDTTADSGGVIFAQGSRFGGHAMFIRDGRLHYVYNFLGVGEEQAFHRRPPRSRQAHPRRRLRPRTSRRGESAQRHHKAYIDDQQVDEGQMRVMAIQFSLCGEGLTVGYDGGDTVSRTYPTRYPFSGGEIVQVVFDVADDTYLDVEQHRAATMARD